MSYRTHCILFSDKASEEAGILESMETPITPFCLLLKHNTAVRLGPKTTLDIPISFAPEEMKKYDGVVTVKVRKEDGSPWIYNLCEERYTFLGSICYVLLW